MSYGNTLTPPPHPTWHGFGQGMHDKYVAFITKHMRDAIRSQPATLLRQLQQHEAILESYQAELQHQRTAETAKADAIAEITRIVNSVPTDEAISEELARLAALEYVLGTRTDMFGCLVIQLRINVEIRGILRDMGDYEVILAFEDGVTGTYPINGIRIPPGVDPYWRIPGFRDAYLYRKDAWKGHMIVEGQHVRLCNLTDLVQTIHDQLIESVNVAEFPQVQEPEQVWDGFTTNPVKAYRRSVAQLTDASPQQRLTTLERELERIKRQIESFKSSIRETQRSIRLTKAEHVKAVKAAETAVIEVDEEALRAGIDKITRFPGVMGIRFTDDGVPVFHIRTSHLYDGRRYDMGDYEITPGTPTSDDKTVTVHTTRTTPGALYHHDRGTRYEWFCFGDRSNELRLLVQAQDLPQFVHLVINTMNAVNRESRCHMMLEAKFHKIPIDAVWQSRGKPTRIRRTSRRIVRDILGMG